MPSAGSTRPYTVSGGNCTTYRHNVVRTMTFSSTFVNKPKKPFQSPCTHQLGFPADAAVTRELAAVSAVLMNFPLLCDYFYNVLGQMNRRRQRPYCTDISLPRLQTHTGRGSMRQRGRPVQNTSGLALCLRRRAEDNLPICPSVAKGAR